MPFDKVETQVDFPALERKILSWWQETQAFEKLRAKNRGKPKWSFLDGPITANNPMGVHHAWGRTYKDAFCRYFAMTGHELRYQNGFDCQGLWVEVEVEKELKLKSKQDIETLVLGDKFKSIDKFVTLCKERVNRFARVQTEQSIRLGMWMDWDRPDRPEDWAKPPDQRRSYFTMSEENNYTIWSFLKKCFTRGLVYRAYDSMPWCPRCAVGISQMEMHEGYQLVAHKAVFVRFPLRGRVNENLLVWTTTPWTLSSNVGAAVNPGLTYVKLNHQDQIYYLAKGALTASRLEEDFKRGNWVEGVPKLKPLAQIFKEKGGYEIVGELKGKEMLGWTYDGPFDELPAQQSPSGYPQKVATNVAGARGYWSQKSAAQSHVVIPWKEVGETEGTGIVHIAPGCGKEDFELAFEVAKDPSLGTAMLPPIAPLDEEGLFLPGFGPLQGKAAYDSTTAEFIFDNLKAKGLLVAVERYPHNYPHCWRCKTELLFRLVDEWYISMAWRDEIMKVVEDVNFLPESINGKARELDWLKNMGDWMISKKRYWGLALPIWVDEESGDFEVIGSREELRARAVEGWNKFEGKPPHRPWIDLIKIKHPKTGRLMSRIPDVGNPWLDAGIVPYSTMKYNTDRAYWQKWFPADFITESFPGQFRNWFYAILAMSTMMEQRAPMKVLLGHGQVRDEHGDEMHKSKGNAIPFEGAADAGYEIKQKDGKVNKYPPISADLMRWMYCRTNPASNINFGPGPAEEIRNKLTMKLWNSYAFFCNYARLDGFDPAACGFASAGGRAIAQDIDCWILSDLQLLIKKARESFESYNVAAFCVATEQFVDDKLSNWYIRRNRRRFWKSEQSGDKQAAYQTLYTVLVTLTKLVAPIMPFLAETMWQNLRGKAEPESVHHCDYPDVDVTLIEADLSADMEALLRLVSLGSAARNGVKIKVRQPLAELKVQPGNEREKRAIERFAVQLCEELNLKGVNLHDPAQGALVQVEVKGNLKTLGPRFGGQLKAVQDAIAKSNASELAKQVQSGHGLELATPAGVVTLEPGDLWVSHKAPTGWAAIVDRGTTVLLDTRISDALKREGQAREVIRHVQSLRKDAGLEMDDRITLHLGSAAPELANAIQEHADYIKTETLTTALVSEPLTAGAAATDVKVDGIALRIELKRT
jgi:isoleucyl-tRNA synthetase